MRDMKGKVEADVAERLYNRNSKINDIRRRRLIEQGKYKLMSLTGLFRDHTDSAGQDTTLRIRLRELRELGIEDRIGQARPQHERDQEREHRDADHDGQDIGRHRQHVAEQ